MSNLKQIYKNMININNINNNGLNIIFNEDVNIDKSLYANVFQCNNLQISNCNTIAFTSNSINSNNIITINVTALNMLVTNLNCLSLINQFTITTNNLKINNNLTFDNGTIFNFINIKNTTRIFEPIVYSNTITAVTMEVESNCDILNKLVLPLNTFIAGFQVTNIYCEKLDFAQCIVLANITSNQSVNASTFTAYNTLQSLNIITNTINFTQGTILNTLAVSNNIITNDLYVSGMNFPSIKNYNNLGDAVADNVPLWGFYRTGNILKIRINNTIPILQLNNITYSSIISGNQYIEYGASVSNITVQSGLTYDIYIDSIFYSNNNYLVNKVKYTTATTLSGFNSKLLGTHIVKYTYSDNYGITDSITRTISVASDLIYPTLQFTGNNIIKLKLHDGYIDTGVFVSDNINTDVIVIKSGTINNNIYGINYLYYSAIDSSNNESNLIRYIIYSKISENIGYIFNPIQYKNLYFNTNFNSINTYDNWYIECYINLLSIENSCVICDFAVVPFTSSIKNFRIYIDTSSRMCTYFGSIDTNYVDTYTNFQLNKWYKLKWAREGNYLRYYINDIKTNEFILDFNLIVLSNLNHLTIAKSVEFGNNANYHMKGKIAGFKIYSNNELLFNLVDNYKDSITNIIGTYTVPPQKYNMNYIDEIYNINNTIITTNLVFHLKANEINNSIWKYNNDFIFVPHNISNNIGSLIIDNNIYGWTRSNNLGWVLQNNTVLKNKNWKYGITLEQWLYIDYNYITSMTTTKMLLAGQSSLYSNYDYGIGLCPSEFSFTTKSNNILSFVTNMILTDGIEINKLRGKWCQITVVMPSSISYIKQFQVYLNGELSMEFTNLTMYPNPSLSTNTFTIGCDKNGAIQTESYNSIYFGDVLLYNRTLIKEEIKSNYNYNIKRHYNNKSINNKSNYTTIIPSYDMSAGYLTYNYDFNFLKTTINWTIELWAFIPDTFSSNIIFVTFYNGNIEFGVTNTFKVYAKFNTVYSINNSIGTINKNSWNHFAFIKSNNKEFCFAINGILEKVAISKDTLNFP